MKRLWLFILLVIFSLVSGAACGYRVLGSEVTASGTRPKLAIPLFTNRSDEVGLEAIFANALIGAFSQSHIARVTAASQADLVLQGDILKVESTSLAYYDIDRSLVRRIAITVELTLKERPEGKTRWKDVQVLEADYVVYPNYHYGEANREQSIREAAAILAQRIHDKIIMIL